MSTRSPVPIIACFAAFPPFTILKSLGLGLKPRNIHRNIHLMHHFQVLSRKKKHMDSIWYLVGGLCGAITCFNQLEQYESMGFGWHPIYEMENIEFYGIKTNRMECLPIYEMECLECLPNRIQVPNHQPADFMSTSKPFRLHMKSQDLGRFRVAIPVDEQPPVAPMDDLGWFCNTNGPIYFVPKTSKNTAETEHSHNLQGIFGCIWSFDMPSWIDLAMGYLFFFMP